MSDFNPYETPEASSDSGQIPTTSTTTRLARAVEYAIAILIVILLVWVVQLFVIA